MLSVKQGGIKYHFFEFLVWLDLGLIRNIVTNDNKDEDNSLKNNTQNIYTINKIFIKLATLVEGDPKDSFSIATTSRCRGGHYYIPWIAPLYPWSLPYNAEC